MNDDTFKAHEVAQGIERLQENNGSGVAGFDGSVEKYMNAVVENGKFIPDCRVKSTLSLSLKERVTGKREQDLTAMLALGLMFGAALERDVPKDSALEDAWRDGAFELPEIDE